MKAKIDLEKLISSMLGYAEDNCEETMLDYLHSALQDQGLEYKDGEIVEIDTIDTSSPRWAEIVKECKHDTLEQGKKITITIPNDLKGTDADGGVVGEKGKQPTEEEIVGMGGLGKVWNEQAIISRLDRIIELLERPIIMPYQQPLQPLQPLYDTNKIYCDTASTEGGEE